MEHNKRKSTRTGGSWYRFRETGWIVSGYRKHHASYGGHVATKGNSSGYSTKFELIKIATSGILTISMVLILVLVIRVLL